jgi:N-acetylmuramoyl-L-alanine amidase
LQRTRALLVVCALVTGTAHAGADEAMADAKDAWAKLKKDDKRRRFRHNWLNVARKLELVAQKFPRSDRAAEAFLLSGELYGELSRISQMPDDLTQSEKSYRKLLDAAPKSKQADDAALALAHLLAERKGDPSAARKVLAQSVEQPGAHKKELKALLATLPEAPHDKPAPAPPPAPPTRVAAKEKADPVQAPLSAAAVESTRAIATALRAAVKAPPARAEAPAVVEEPEGPAAGRRLPPSRLHDEPADVGLDDVEEGAELPAIASLQEKLRDVRVGVKLPQASSRESAEARARLRTLAKDEEGSELSIAQQLGLKFRKVIIDAGHGGHDTGAIGADGTREKDVALAIALKLAKKLKAQGLEVVLTRDDDTFVRLEDRTQIANREKGDLFISVHCNAAASRKLRGIETYSLNTSSNRYSIRLAARENASSDRGVGDLQYILADLATKANTGDSARLADRVEQTLVRNLTPKHAGVKGLGTKEALFYVLLGAKMPAILVETSFISNPDEEALLADEKYQGEVADSIAEAVDGFLEERNKVAQVE